MTSPSTRRLAMIISALVFTSASCAAKTVVVGACLPNVQTFSTISQAVASVVSGSTILVCPGTYPEQVVVTHPLRLQGVQSGNSANPIITVPSGGLTKSVVAPTNGVTMFFQILVQGTESGLVQISNIAVDGKNSHNQLLAGWISGIYYQNSSGTVRNVAVHGQKGNGFGFGIFLEGTTAPAKTIGVLNSSVHDFDAEGIRSNGSPAPSLTLNIQSNSVISSNALTGKAVSGGIDLQGAQGSISNNRVISHPAAPGVSAGAGIVFSSDTLVSGNTVVSWTLGLIGLSSSNTVRSNMLSLAGIGIVMAGDNNVVQNNSVLNMGAGAGISFNCTGTSNIVTNNLINDSAVGIENHPGNTVTPNTFSNVAITISPPC